MILFHKIPVIFKRWLALSKPSDGKCCARACTQAFSKSNLGSKTGQFLVQLSSGGECHHEDGEMESEAASSFLLSVGKAELSILSTAACAPECGNTQNTIPWDKIFFRWKSISFCFVEKVLSVYQTFDR